MYAARVCKDCGADCVFFCETCGKDLCSVHKGVHMVDLDNANHFVILYRERNGYFIKDEYCEKHPELACKLWCDTCDEPFCDECWKEKKKDHEMHAMMEVFEAYKKYKEEFKPKIAQLRSEVLPYNRAILAGIEPDIPECEAQIAELKEKMRDKAERLKKFTLERLRVVKHLRTVPVTGVKSACHMSCKSATEFWISDKVNLVLIDQTGKKLSDVKDKLDKECGVHAVTKDGDLIYIDKKSNIRKLLKDKKDKPSTLINSKESWETLSVFCSFESDDILVGMIIHNINRAMVVRYSSDGKEKHFIECEHYTTPLFVTENHNQDVVVSNHDRNSSSVVVTNGGGEYRFSFNGPPKEPGFKPRSICVDGLSNILVYDDNSKSIVMIDVDGHYLEIFQVQQNLIQSPRCVSYSIDNHTVFVYSSSNSHVVVSRHINRQEYLGTSAFKGLVAEVGYGYEAAEVAHVDSVRIRRLKETLSQELGSTVSYLTISLHLTET
uniref:Uncharacterized protein n=1 Tax=Magallana gigas TaxID=29159 RepID=K1QRD8_MAGGI